MKMVLVFLMLFHCHQEIAQFNIISVLLNIIFKDTLKVLLNCLELFFCSMSGVPKLLQSCKRGTKTFWSILSFAVGVPKLLKRLCWGTKTLCHMLLGCHMLPGLKNSFNSSKIPSALVPSIKNDYSLTWHNLWNLFTSFHNFIE